MPEYLAPGVYVEEVSFRNKSIEGVSTSVTGMVGAARYGPVGGSPELLTSFADFDRIYGGLDPLQFTGEDPQPNFLALGARQFFDNGGTKLYVTRVLDDPAIGVATVKTDPVNGPDITARFPGAGGNMDGLRYGAAFRKRSVRWRPAPNLRNVKVGDTVFVSGKTCAIQSGYYDVVQGAGANMKLTGSINNVAVNIAESDIITANMDVYRVSLLVSARRSGRFEIEEPLGAFAPAAGVANSLSDYFVPNPESRSRFLTQPFFLANAPASGAATAAALLGPDVRKALVKMALPAWLPKPPPICCPSPMRR